MDYKVKGLQFEREKKTNNFSTWKAYVEQVTKGKKNKEEKKNA